MKKKYMQPSVEVVKVKSETMICTSIGVKGTASELELAGKRRGSVDDEDDFFGDESIW